MRLIILIAILMITAGPVVAQQAVGCENPILEVGVDGSIVAGSKSALINMVQRGESIRVGWDRDFDGDGKSDLSHWSAAQFLSVFQGEVATQLQSIHRQTPVRASGQINLPSSLDKWHGLLDSRGVLRGRLESASKVSERNVHSVWCLAQPQTAWRLVYRHDLYGNQLEGTKTTLLNAIRSGQEIQIGWGLKRSAGKTTKSVEHLVAPVFVTITDEAEVSAQMPEHIGQQSYWEIDKSKFSDGAVMWRGLATTKGLFDAIWVNRGNGEVVRRAPQRAAFSWFVQGPVHHSTSLATQNGVIAEPLKAQPQTVDALQN